MKRYLLLISCSNRKVETNIGLPAIERYDGGTYRVIRKMQREKIFPNNIDVKIISAKFGLIDSETNVPYYDQRLDKQRVAELKSEVQRKFLDLISTDKYSKVYVDLGKDYLALITDLDNATNKKLIFSQGRIGERLSKLRNWLLLKR